MTRDDIIRMAREVWGDDSGKPWSDSALFHLTQFAALVAAAEREACAKLCEEPGWNQGKMFAKEIRARGETK